MVTRDTVRLRKETTAYITLDIIIASNVHRSSKGCAMIKHMQCTIFSLVILLTSFGCARENKSVADLEQQLLQAIPLPLEDVRLTGGPLKHSQDLDAKILLGLEPCPPARISAARSRIKPSSQLMRGSHSTPFSTRV